MSIYGMGNTTSTYAPAAKSEGQQAQYTYDEPAPSSDNQADVMAVIMPMMMELLKVITQAVSGGQDQQAESASSNVNYDDNSSIEQT